MLDQFDLLPAAVLLLLAGGLALWRADLRSRRLDLEETPVLTAAEVVAALDGREWTRCLLAGTTGPGPEGPLTAPFSGRPCVWYRVSVTQTYQVVTEVQTNRRDNSEPPTVRRTTTHTEPLFDRRSRAVFQVRDDTGAVHVDPRGAIIEGVSTSYDGPVRPTTPEAEEIAVPDRDDATARVRYTEESIAAGTKLYLRGDVVAADTAPLMRTTATADLRVADRSPREATGRLRERERLLFAGAVAMVSVAVLVLVWPVLG